MSALDIAAEIAKVFEGFRSRPYFCPAGVATIGYGSTMYPGGKRVTLKDPPIGKDRAEELLFWEMRKSLSGAIRYCPILALNDNRLAAITDFVYNLGAGRLQTSTLRRKINQEDWGGAKVELMRWVRGGGRVLPGLVKRRTMEVRLL